VVEVDGGAVVGGTVVSGTMVLEAIGVVEAGAAVEVGGAVVDVIDGTWHGSVVVTAGTTWSGAYCLGVQPKSNSTVWRTPLLPSADRSAHRAERVVCGRLRRRRVAQVVTQPEQQG